MANLSDIPLRDTIGIITMPRLAFTENAFCLYELGFCKMRVRRLTGVFWTECLARLIQDALCEDNVEYVLTVDYDSVFKSDDVRRLRQLMDSPERPDAVFAMQMRRDEPVALGTLLGEKGDITVGELSKPLYPMSTGHFGLTMLRASALRDLPRPWFIPYAGPQGDWKDGRQDADITFWRDWEKAGFTLYTTNQVVVGHLQLMVTWPDAAMNPVFQFPGDYTRHGKPPGMWGTVSA